ncbi:MAG: hypothetical protein KF683_08110, partial [Rubrivivax sp.]|nr:hypothetical protein [Rubrivivax sp.]
GDRNASHFIYAHGLVWNPDLPEPWNRLRLDTYLAVGPEGRGTGKMGDHLQAWANAHLRVHETVREGNRYEFRGEVTAAATAAFVGQPVVVMAVTQGDGTLLNLEFGGQVFPGLGRITNVRACGCGILTPPSFIR